MSTLAAGLPQLTATVGTSLQTLAEGVVVAHPARDEITHAEAAALTGEIRAALHDLVEMVTAVGHLVTAAWAMRADRALGYASWEDYCAHLFADVRSTRLPVQTRRSVVVALRAAGMSTRATGSVLGVHHDTVASDLRATVGNPTDDVVGLDGRRRATTRTSSPQAASQTATPPGRAKTLQTLELLEAAGETGLTWAELSDRTGWHHGIASATLSRLHRQGRVTPCDERRNRSSVYRRSPDMVKRHTEPINCPQCGAPARLTYETMYSGQTPLRTNPVAFFCPNGDTYGSLLDLAEVFGGQAHLG